VRLEALRTATFLRQPAAIEALAIVDEFPTDEALAYVKQEAKRVLEPEFQRAQRAGERLVFRTDAGRRFLYRSLSNDALAAVPRSPLVYREMLLRPGLDDRLRAEAVAELAGTDRTSVVKVVADALATLDAREGEVDSATGGRCCAGSGTWP
jgi:hypothetical protein